jgi:hypothetical protein
LKANNRAWAARMVSADAYFFTFGNYRRMNGSNGQPFG